MVMFLKTYKKKFGPGVWGTRLKSDVSKHGINKTCFQTLDPTPFGDALRYINLPRIFATSGWCARRGDILPLPLYLYVRKARHLSCARRTNKT
jgi:hypothetical protein